MEANLEAAGGVEWWRWGDERAVWEGVKEREVRRRADYVSQVEGVAELWARTGRVKEDRLSMVADLMAVLGLTRGEGRELLRHAELVFGSDAVRGAARAGVLSRQHLNVIDKTLAEVPVAERERVEATLLENAGFDGVRFRDVAQRIVRLLDQDGKAPDEGELARPRREFHCRGRRDGSVEFRGWVDAEAGAMLEALLSPLAKPTSGRDARAAVERQGDAFVEIVEMAAMSEDLPVEGGERPHLALTMSMAEFLALRGVAEVEGGGVVDAVSARRLGCDSRVMRVVLGADGEVLDVGRRQRTIPNQIRRALIVRDRECGFPGCHRRPRQCHGHHVVSWAQGGPTSLDNVVLVCGAHHRLLHHGHWAVRIEGGRPVFWNRLAEAS